MRRVRQRDRSWIAVLAGCVGLYAVLAAGFHWFVEPAIRTGRASLPTETLIVYRNFAYRSSSSEEPTTSGHALRAAAPVAFAKSEPPRPVEVLAPAKADQADGKPPDGKPPDAKVPKKDSHRNVTRQANERVAQHSAEHRGAGWGFSSSPASPNFR
jgi:hypothetical protein